MSVAASYYQAPNGIVKDIVINNVSQEDSDFFNSNQIQISLEEIGGQIVVYAFMGEIDEDGIPYEIIVFAGNRSCEETMHEVRERCEEKMKEKECTLLV